MTTAIPLDTLAATIKARIEKGDRATADAEGHYLAAGLHLIEAKARVRNMPGLTWAAFLQDQCGVQRRRADELIAIAEGRTTLAAVREATKRKVAAHRARTREESALRNAEVGATQQVSRLTTALAAFDTLSQPEREEFLRMRRLVKIATTPAANENCDRQAA